MQRFPSSVAARSLLRHVACLLVAGEAGWEIMVPRSFARTVVHELSEAMRGVAGRRALEAREHSDPA
jgi:sarcosine oxidase gamma subunit